MRRDRAKHPERNLRRFLSIRDLSYIVRDYVTGNWALQGPADVTLDQAIAEAEFEFKTLVKNRQTRLVLDSLENWSLLNTVLNRGFNFVTVCHGASMNGNFPQPIEIKGRFSSKEEAETVVNLVIEEQTAPLLGKYA